MFAISWSFAFLPAMRVAGSPPGTTMKIRKTMKLTAIRTAIAPMRRRTTKANISGLSGRIAELLGCECQARQGRRECSGYSARTRLRTLPGAAQSRARGRRMRPERPLMLDPHLRPRVERVPQAVAEDVQRDDGDHDCDSRSDRQPRRRDDPVLPLRDQLAPGGVRVLDPRTEERQRRLEQDVVRDDEREEDECRGRDVREDLAEHDPQRPGALRGGGLHEFLLPQREDLTAQ